MVKRIIMNKGAKGGLQYHRRRDEAGVMIRGAMLVRFDPGSGQLSERFVQEGDVFHFPRGAVHQAEAITDCEYIEVSTPFINDRVHVEHEYGIEREAGGLPTTKPEDIVAA